MDLYEACICYFLCNMDPSILLLSTDFDLYENWELPGVQDGFRKGSRIRDQIANICWVIEKEREFQKNIYFCFTDYAKTFDCVDHTQKKKKKKWKILTEMEIPGHLIYILKNPYAGQEKTVRDRHGTMGKIQIGKGVYQGHILSLYLFNLYTEYITQNAGWTKHRLEWKLPQEKCQ